jgi:putative inorganic carbon (HCO3(-)) transporter
LKTSNPNQSNLKAGWKHIAIALLFSLVYSFSMSYFVRDEKFIALFLPAVLLVAIFVFVRMDYALLTIFLLTPLSVPLREYFPSLGIDMYLPTEPLLVMISFLFLSKLLLDKIPDKRFFTHPVSLVIYFSLFWILVTSISSSLPAVSFKFLASRIWFLLPFYFLSGFLFYRLKNIRLFYILYTIGLMVVILYSTNRHMGYGLMDQEASNWVSSPFYNDHTAYGAALAIVLFNTLGLLFSRKNTKWFRLFGLGALAVLLFALVFSFSRAAWISVVGALGVLILVWLKIKFKWVALITVILVGLISFFYLDIMHTLEKNEQDSSGNFSQHITSITNISTDASNVERLNRWNSAIRMFREKPLLGWGPGTYTFQYAPFQYAREKTIISTNFGDGGNAHSEYLGPLAESGIFGPLYFLLIGIFSLLTGFRVYHRSKEKEVRIMALFTTLGLITYLLHAFLNNFLDTDKLSALFWGSIAVLVALDLRRKSQEV